ncbi:uncharacterized protein LOC132285926 [Cornus florida]|uniref:uncharacterized protein LOC132285926 n=1 Tax=Cornus florida TaxID=4283 RepID=UPI00289BF693|nr:uncharacterized protein LOC132285926 [Cornus florida]
MVIVKEEAYSKRVRVFRWNEKLRKNRISESQGLFVYFITSKFTTLNPNNGHADIDVEEKRLKRAIRFDLTGLLSHDSIKSLPHTVLAATKQFLPETIVPLGDQISDNLLKSFNFCPNNFIGTNLPKIVIVTEIYRIRIMDHTDIDLNISPTPMLPPIPPQWGYDSDSDSDPFLPKWGYDSDDELSISDHQNQIDYETEEAEDDPSDSYSADVEFYLAIIREFLGEKGYIPLRVVAINEPRGLVEVEPVRLFQAEEEKFSGGGNKCLICLDELTTAAVITRMSCSHVYHTRCIFEWLWSKNTCPTCRKPWPLL